MTGPARPLVGDPGRVADLARQMQDGSLTAEVLTRRCLDRIAEVDGTVQAFIHVLADDALAQARRLDAERRAGHLRGPLHGIPLAVKDVMDVAGLPTRANSRVRAGAPPATADATVVAHLRAAGCIVLGKVHTTEFAYFESVPPTRNPHDPTRTPGGSSAGSAAAVAAGMVPLALGTQTAGSVNRPASYCGVGAFKPSTLAIGGTGVIPLSPSFDTVGAFGGSAADATLLAMAFAPAHLRLDRALNAPGENAAHRPAPSLRVVRPDDPLLDDLSAPRMTACLAGLARRLAGAGVAIAQCPSPVSLGDVLAAHRIVLVAELGRTHARLDRSLLAPRLAADIEAGLATPDEDYHAALRRLAALRRAFWQAFGPDDLILLPAAPDVAPADGSTGDPRLVIPATALGGAVASIRAGHDAELGLPVGAMLMAAPGADARLAEVVLSGALAALDL